MRDRVEVHVNGVNGSPIIDDFGPAVQGVHELFYTRAPGGEVMLFFAYEFVMLNVVQYFVPEECFHNFTENACEDNWPVVVS